MNQTNLNNPLLRISGIAALLVCLVASALFTGCKAPTVYRTAPVERGDIVVQVTATGTLNPYALVQVGTQVSGTINRMYADFNSQVKKGQLIALLDTTFLHASVEEAKAGLRRVQAQELLARRTSERTAVLVEKGLAAQTDLDQAIADYEGAKASMASGQAQLDRAKINLAYAYVRSPISGIVVNRNVDVGQTVAASFNTPTSLQLLTI